MSCKSSYEWIPNQKGEVPSNAFKAGTDRDDSDIYVGRAKHDGHVLPGKIVPKLGCCYVSEDGKEYKKFDYEVLCVLPDSKLDWVDLTDGNIPEDALEVGKTSGGETLYIGLTYVYHTITIGKVHPKRGGMKYSYSGEEHDSASYQVLTCKNTK